MQLKQPTLVYYDLLVSTVPWAGLNMTTIPLCLLYLEMYTFSQMILTINFSIGEFRLYFAAKVNDIVSTEYYYAHILILDSPKVCPYPGLL